MRISTMIVLLVFAPAARAGHLGLYDFTNRPGDEPNVPVETQPTNATLSPITRGGGVKPEKGLHSINSSNWKESSGFHQFVITPKAGQFVSLSSLVFSDRRSAEGPVYIDVRFSFNHFATSTLAARFVRGLRDVSNHRDTVRLDIFDDLTDFTKAVTFRILAFSVASELGTFRLGVDLGSLNHGIPKNLILNSPAWGFLHIPPKGYISRVRRPGWLGVEAGPILAHAGFPGISGSCWLFTPSRSRSVLLSRGMSQKVYHLRHAAHRVSIYVSLSRSQIL
jgi:hypothetical protein